MSADDTVFISQLHISLLGALLCDRKPTECIRDKIISVPN